MKKVLFFIPTLAHGGAEKVLVNLVNNMDSKKYDITVKTIFDGGVNRKYLNKNINYQYQFKKQFRGLSKICKAFSPEHLYKKYIKCDYDIVVSYLEGVTARIISGCPNPKTKKVSWIHIEQHNISTAAAAFKNAEEAKKCYESFDKTICVSQTVLEDFKSVFDFKKPIEVLYNTNESNRVKTLSKDAVNDVDFDKNVFNLCSVGKVVTTKGYDKLARIHKRLLDAGIKNHVYILGIGEDQPKIEKYLSENNLSSSFTFLGYKDNPYKYVQKCDLFVCSSLREGFSTSVTESLIVGTPVVTTLCSGMCEMLGENNEYGLVVDNDENALYDGVKRMLTENGLLEQYKSMAQGRGNHFTTESTVNATEKMFDSLFKDNSVGKE